MVKRDNHVKLPLTGLARHFKFSIERRSPGISKANCRCRNRLWKTAQRPILNFHLIVIFSSLKKSVKYKWNSSNLHRGNQYSVILYCTTTNYSDSYLIALYLYNPVILPYLEVENLKFPNVYRCAVC